jgi:hypothetical protein
LRNIGITYDLRDDYLAAGYTKEATAEFDRVDTIDALEEALLASGYLVRRIGNIRSLESAWPPVSGGIWSSILPKVCMDSVERPRYRPCWRRT